ELEFHEKLAQACRTAGAPPLFLCFGVHPQLCKEGEDVVAQSFSVLDQALAEKKIHAIGEVGFDLYDASFRVSENMQRRLFEAQLALAQRYSLPVVLHVRRAMPLVFSYLPLLKKLPAVVFHSYSGTLGEALSLLQRGVTAFFSFGNTLLLNHKQARAVCAQLPVKHLLFETDAPYQGQRGASYASYRDLPRIVQEAVQLRKEKEQVFSAEDLAFQVEENFFQIFSRGG
ncbi:MAG: TatD family hydrolase, partial [Treponemataceae bacterium]|nr:TatD family hydrolase [Treponemataceae bacterium]